MRNKDYSRLRSRRKSSGSRPRTLQRRSRDESRVSLSTLPGIMGDYLRAFAIHHKFGGYSYLLADDVYIGQDCASSLRSSEPTRATRSSWGSETIDRMLSPRCTVPCDCERPRCRCLLDPCQASCFRACQDDDHVTYLMVTRLGILIVSKHPCHSPTLTLLSAAHDV